MDAQIRNCASGIEGGRNRWFDKAVSIVVETNGRSGIMGEHSPVDALIPSIVVDYVLAKPVNEAVLGSRSGNRSTEKADGWARLDWVTDEAMLREIEECRGRNSKLIEDSDASQLWWGEYGAEWIKKHGKYLCEDEVELIWCVAIAQLSPDAYLQQALQLAWYRDQGYATATYETASTRMMLHGRTDVIRTLSTDSRAFVKAMLDSKLDVSRLGLSSGPDGWTAFETHAPHRT